MNIPPNLSIPFIPRPNEYERLVASLVDQSFFEPVAITTSLAGVRGMGKTALAREVCRDPRVVEAFSDGVMWVTLGENLSPLQLLSRIERLVFDLSGEQRGLVDLKTAQDHLRDLIHPRRILIVLDEVGEREAVLPFLQTGPGGRVLMITRSVEPLPLGTREIPVDIMVTGEAVALLSAGLAELATTNDLQPSRSAPLPLPFQSEIETPPVEAEPSAVEAIPAPFSAMEGSLEEELTEGVEDPGDLSEAPMAVETLPSLLEAEVRDRLLNAGLTDEAVAMLVDLAGRLNEWPLLLILVNGLLRGCFDQGSTLGGQSISGSLQAVVDLLERSGLAEMWPVNNPISRARALTSVVTSCLDPLPNELRDRLFDLVVFPLYEEIPLAAVSVLWRTSAEETYTSAALLARRALVALDPAAWTIQLHPLLVGYINDHLRLGVLAALHRRLVDGYAARCRENPAQAGTAGWATGPDDGYYFQHLGLHLVAAGLRLDLQNLLFDFNWFTAYLNCTNLLSGRRGDLYSLLLDFELAHSVALDRQSAELRLIEEALRMAAPMLTRDPGQLAPQLIGRLLPFTEPEIQGLLRQAENWTAEPWLRPLAACFSPPGGDEVRAIAGHTDWVTCLDLLPDGQFAVSGSLDGTLRWWDLANGQNMRTVSAHPGGVSVVSVTQDGRKVVTAGWDGRVRVWNAINGESLLDFKAHNDAAGALALTPDGQRIITGSDDNLVRIWDLATGTQIRELIGHGDPVRTLAVSPDGRVLASGSWDHAVRTWDLDSGVQLNFFSGHEAWVRSVVFTPDSRFILSGGWDRTVRVWDCSTGELSSAIQGVPGPIFALALTPAADRLLVGTGESIVKLYSFPGGEDIGELRGHSGGVNQVVVTREGRFAVTAADDRTLRTWDLVALQAVRPQPGHSASVYALLAIPNTNYSISGSWDGTLKVWNLATGAAVSTLTGHTGGIIALAVSADGRRAVSGARDHMLKVWNLAGMVEERTLPGHAGSITALSITPDGRCAVSGADDGTLIAWDLDTGHRIADFRGEGAIWTCAISADGRTITASESGGKLYFLEIKR